MRTNKTHKFISLLFLVVFIIAGNSVISSKKGDIDSHLNDYAYYNVAHHDNIDDEPHTHTHKHSEDGDEHELGLSSRSSSPSSSAAISPKGAAGRWSV